MNIYVERITQEARLPEMRTDHAACFDVFADLQDRTLVYYRNGREPRAEHCCDGSYSVYPGERVLVPTGNKVCCDPGWKIVVYPRSGVAFKKGLTLINCVGVIDADYRGELCLLMINNSSAIVEINHHNRLAQIAIEPVHHAELCECILPDTDSNRTGGIGSTGE